MKDYFFDGSGWWFFVVFGLICLLGGIRQIIVRKGRIRGRGGHVTVFEGKEAVARGAIAVFIGAVVLLLCALAPH